MKEQIQKEQDRIQALNQEREEKAERVQRERENWERRLLGIGECCLEHDNDNCNPLHSSTNMFHRLVVRLYFLFLFLRFLVITGSQDNKHQDDENYLATKCFGVL